MKKINGQQYVHYLIRFLAWRKKEEKVFTDSEKQVQMQFIII